MICDIGIGTLNVCKAVCFEVVCEGDFGMLLFVSIKSFFLSVIFKWELNFAGIFTNLVVIRKGDYKEWNICKI